MANPKLRTNVPSDLVADDDLVTQFNRLNALIVHGVPEMARAYDSVERHLPLLREMQSVLSQRPMTPAGPFTMMGRVRLLGLFDATVRVPIQVRSRRELPTWSQWLEAYAFAIDYSVRHIRRKMKKEPRRAKTVKECGWAKSDHNNLIRAATLGIDLVSAIEHGADTAMLVREFHEIMDRVPEDVYQKTYEDNAVTLRRRPMQSGTWEEVEVEDVDVTWLRSKKRRK
jgi:hypothetical protein